GTSAQQSLHFAGMNLYHVTIADKAHDPDLLSGCCLQDTLYRGVVHLLCQIGTCSAQRTLTADVMALEHRKEVMRILQAQPLGTKRPMLGRRCLPGLDRHCLQLRPT